MQSKENHHLMKYLFLFFALFLFTPGFTQDVKKINKVIKVFDKDKEKGLEKMRKLMSKEDYPTLTAYEVLVKMEFLDFEARYALFDRMTMTVESNGAEKQENVDSSFQLLISEAKIGAENHFLNVCRRSTVESNSYTADVYLRIFLIDYSPDTAISEEGLDFFANGEEYFVNEKYELAELEYRKALDSDPNYFKAILYLGDSFWAREMPDSAIYFYEVAKNMHPNLLEPRKYIVDALTNQGLYYRAKKECLKAFCVYPGFDMKQKFQNILSVENKWMNDHRFIRYFYPNDINYEQGDLPGMWSDYRAAKDKVSKYCDDNGIIEENGLTDEKYLEVYSLQYLLEENQNDLPEYLEFAWKMKEEGYLEPYVFISLFHVDIYPQFEVYMEDEENRKKAIEYVEKYLIQKIE
jgi:tetratricopeptide (TPR) repeat protein